MITSTANAQVKELVKLMKKSRARDEARLFLIEGPRMAGELVSDPDWCTKIQKIYLSESYAVKNEGERESLENTAAVEILSDPVFAHVSGTKTPQGILAVVKRRTYNMSDILGDDPGRTHVLVLDNLQDPGNLGTIFRTAEAAGVTGIILSRDCVDIYNPKVIRSTMGSVYRVPFTYVEDLKDVMKLLKEHHITSYAAHLKGENVYERDFRSACAFLIGNEGNGLTDEISTMAEQYIKIPMCGKLESLNAAIAAAVLMYETRRQRL